MLVYNPSDGPVLVSPDGVQVPGREQADVEENETVHAHIAAGRLVQIAPTKKKSYKPSTTIPVVEAADEE